MTDLTALHNLVVLLIFAGMTLAGLKKLGGKVNTLREYLDYWFFGYWIDDNVVFALSCVKRILPSFSIGLNVRAR